jgi:hypothetical protein
MLHLGVAGEEPNIRLFVFFPYMKKSFQSEEMLWMWTDDILIPSCSCHLPTNVLQHLPGTYRQIQAISGAGNHGDALKKYFFGRDKIHEMWADIVENT